MHTIRNAFAYSNMTYVRKNSAVRSRYRKLRTAILSGYVAKYKTKKDYTKPPSGRKSGRSWVSIFCLRWVKDSQ